MIFIFCSISLILKSYNKIIFCLSVYLLSHWSPIYLSPSHQSGAICEPLQLIIAYSCDYVLQNLHFEEQTFILLLL